MYLVLYKALNAYHTDYTKRNIIHFRTRAFDIYLKNVKLKILNT